MYDLVVTKDSALVTYLRKTGIADPSVPVKYPVTAMDVIGKNVIGKLPHSLSCVALSYTEIPLHLPAGLKDTWPILADYERYADAPVSYIIQRRIPV